MRKSLKKVFLFFLNISLFIAIAADTSLFSSDILQSAEDVTRIASLLEKESRGRIKRSPALAKVILEESAKHKLDPLLVIALIRQESRFRPRISSHKSALGLMQIKESTAKEVAKKLNWRSFSREDLLDPIKNVKLGINYLAKLKKQFRNDKILFLTAYNNGPARLKILCKKPPKEKLKFTYARNVLSHYKTLKSRYAPSKEFSLALGDSIQ